METGRLQDAPVHLPRGALHQTGHEGEGGDHECHDHGGAAHGGAHDQAG